MPVNWPQRPCPICDNLGRREILHRQRFFEGPLGDGYNVVVCAACGAGFADHIPSQQELDRYYAEQSKYTYAHSGGVESAYDFKRFEIIADQLETRLTSKTARILDIGCATGGLLAVLKKRGYVNVVGSDPSIICAETAWRLHGIKVHVATIAEHINWTERFDAVLLVGVLEHLREVRDAVKIAAGLLAKQGVIYCAQPDVEAFSECVNAPYQQFSTEHINYFSLNSLAGLMTTAGFAAHATWRWLVEWREGITDSVVSGLFTRSASVPEEDYITARALRRYISVCAEQEAEVISRINEVVRGQEPLLIWGTGSLTRHLLATTQLAQANIVAFVDANPASSHDLLLERKIISPAEVSYRNETILICTRAFELEIRRIIRNELHLPNQVRSLFPNRDLAK